MSGATSRDALSSGGDPAAGLPGTVWTRLPGPVRDLAVFCALAVFPVVPFGIVFGAPWWMVALLVGQAAVVVALRRRRPLAALAVAVGFFVLALPFGVANPIPALPVAVAAYAVASRHDRRTWIRAVAASVGVMALAALVLVPQALMEPRAVSTVTVVAAAAALGDATRSRRAYIRAITERARRAEESRETEARRRVAEDRLRTARDLHDVVAHQIAVINLHAGVASAALRTSPAEAEESLRTVRAAARAVLTEIGDLLAVLRSTNPTGAAELAVAGLEDLPALVGAFGDVGLRVTTEVDGALTDLPPAVDVVAYRVVQEGLTNASKHGSGGTATVAVSSTGAAVRIRVTNPRVPGGADRAGSSGYGLQGVRERVESVRGTMRTDSTDPSRFTLEVELPRQPQASRPAAAHASVAG